VGLLDGGLQAVFGAAFGVIYLPGEIHRAVRDEADNGDVSVCWAHSPMRYQPDRITEAMRQADGFTDKDAAFLILQAGVDEPDTDCEMTAGGRWAIKSVDADPANTHWIIRASPA
jgi:hypothetical protein